MKTAPRPKYTDMMERIQGIPTTALEDWEIHGHQICEQMKKDPYYNEDE